mmetsp:Transcript_22707/g.74127  ORF Transcript_22707/g.74127 Transcript_22707/m.74127 type:complete len:212 (+) Transcript_22707:694-1329(+)
MRQRSLKSLVDGWLDPAAAAGAAAGAVAGAVAGAPAGAGVAPPGKHLTFCMAPEDILIRNSFHMLSETEKNARREEYKASEGATRRKSKDGGAAGKSKKAKQPGPLPVVTAVYEPAGSSSSVMAVVATVAAVVEPAAAMAVVEAEPPAGVAALPEVATPPDEPAAAPLAPLAEVSVSAAHYTDFTQPAVPHPADAAVEPTAFLASAALAAE